MQSCSGVDQSSALRRLVSIGPRLAAGAACVALFALTACGGGGSSSGTGAAPQGQDLSSANYLPLQVGNRWIYQSSDAGRPVTVRLTGTTSVNGVAGVVEQSDDPDDNATSVLVADAQGVRQFPAADADALTAAVGPVQLLRYPLRVGDAFVAADKSVGAVADIDGDGTADAATVHADAKVVAVESVTTTAGTFADCVHLKTTATVVVQSSALKQSITVTTVTDDWLAPGIGPVRSVSVSTGNGNSVSTTQSITAYGIGTARSESVAPTATAAALTGTAPLGPHTTIDIAFSEDMDTTTLAGALQVLDAAGQAIAGTVTVTARSLHFAPTAGWTSGQFTARLSAAATDLVGNPVSGPATWSFTIDATGLALLQSQPADGAADVPLTGSITLTFNKPLDPATVTADTLGFRENGAALPPFDYRVSGAVITLTPRAALDRGAGYQVQLRGIGDAEGNLIVSRDVTFQSDFGRFGAPTRLTDYAGLTAAAAAGDVDGDGRTDLVYPTYDPQDSSRSRLAISLQRADGTLADAITVALEDFGCTPSKVAVGDIDGDGRNEIIVARSHSCSTAVFREAPDGTFQRDTSSSLPPLDQFQLVDVYGEGKADVVSFGGYDPTIGIWSNVAGAWALRDTISVSTSTLAFGDLDGDGRPDIIVTAPYGSMQADVGLLVQASDGHFGAPTWLVGDPSGQQVAHVGVGDIDGDGRNDIVVSLRDGIGALRQTSPGQFAFQSVVTDGLAGPVKLADINGDGRMDIVYQQLLSSVTILLQQPDGSLGVPATYPADYRGGAGDLLTIADLNGDGRPDIVSTGYVFLQREVPVLSQSHRSQAGVRGKWMASVRRVARALLPHHAVH